MLKIVVVLILLSQIGRSASNRVTIITGLFDFQKIEITVLRTAFAKLVPSSIVYRDYQSFKTNSKENWEEKLMRILI